MKRSNESRHLKGYENPIREEAKETKKQPTGSEMEISRAIQASKDVEEVTIFNEWRNPNKSIDPGG